MIIVTGAVIARPEGFEALSEASLAHVRRSRAEPGCIHHAVNVDAENPLRLFFFEKWESMEALEAHFKVPASNEFMRDVAALSDRREAMEIWSADPHAPPRR